MKIKEDQEKENYWDGIERRVRMKDHDLLTKIDVSITNFVQRFEDHASKDKEEFNEMKSKMEKNTWFIALGTGIIICIEFFKNLIFK